MKINCGVHRFRYKLKKDIMSDRQEINSFLRADYIYCILIVHKIICYTLCKISVKVKVKFCLKIK